jgi:hypothetical protein
MKYVQMYTFKPLLFPFSCLLPEIRLRLDLSFATVFFSCCTLSSSVYPLSINSQENSFDIVTFKASLCILNKICNLAQHLRFYIILPHLFSGSSNILTSNFLSYFIFSLGLGSVIFLCMKRLLLAFLSYPSFKSATSNASFP